MSEEAAAIPQAKASGRGGRHESNSNRFGELPIPRAVDALAATQDPERRPSSDQSRYSEEPLYEADGL